jgi:hypothetical protein
MANVKKLITMIERLEKGFSIEELDINVDDKEFTFVVSFPKQGELNPPGGMNVMAIKGKGDLDAYYEKPYKSSMEGPGGGGYDIGINYAAGFLYVDEDGKETRVDPEASKIIEDIIKKNFEDEFLERITDKFEQDRTEYRGD